MREVSETLQWMNSLRADVETNFFGRILSSCRQEERENLPAPAAVSIAPDGCPLFIVRPSWWRVASAYDKLCVARHEAAHLVLNHPARRWEMFLGQSPEKIEHVLGKLTAISIDLAVNSLILQELYPTMCLEAPNRSMYPGLTPEDEEKMDAEDRAKLDAPMMLALPKQFSFPEKLSFEDYTLRLLKNPLSQQASKLAEALEQAHACWGDALKGLSEAEADKLMRQGQQEMRKLVKEANDSIKDRGTLPRELQSAIDELLEEPKVPWERIFANMTKATISSKLTESMWWPNVAVHHLADYGIEPFPGHSADRTFHIVTCVDTSGSMSDDDFAKAMNEIRAIMRAEAGISTHLIYFDAAIQHECKLDSRSSAEKIKEALTTRHGHGGTDFMPPFLRVAGNQDKNLWVNSDAKLTDRLPTPNLMIMFTDGYAPVSSDEGGPMPGVKLPCPVLWVITQDGKIDPAMGTRVVQITE